MDVSPVKIIYEDNHLLVVEKPVNILVQANNSNDEDLLTILKQYLKNKYHKPGNVYLGLVHRLDRMVGGIMVFAKTSKAASRLSEQIRTKQLQKNYYAVVENKVIPENGILKDYLIKNHDTNISYVTKDQKLGKEAILNYKTIGYKNNLSLVKINLITGRSHQIRVQFAHHSNPLYGDHKYNQRIVKDNIALYAYELSFNHPTTKEELHFYLDLPTVFPFNLFKQ